MRWGALLIVLAACAEEGGVGVLGRELVEGRDTTALTVASYARPVAPTSASEWQARATDLRDYLRVQAGLEYPRPTPAAQVLGERTISGVRIVDVLVEGYGGMHIPATLYLPAAATEPVAGVVVNIGHDASGQSAAYIRTISWSLARSGVAAMSLDWLGMGTRFMPEQRHIPLGLRSIMAGLPPTAPMLEEPLRVFDYLASRPEVDPTRVGMVGQSGGGMVTMHLAALDERIAAAVVVDITVPNSYMVETLGGWGDPDSIVDGFMKLSDHGELLAMVAPRPLLVLSGEEDAIAPTMFVDDMLVFTRGVYTLLGAPEAVGSQGFPTRHCFCDTKIAAALAFLGQELKGAPIVAEAVASGTAPLATLPADDPIWLDLVNALYLLPPAAPDSFEAAMALIRATCDELLRGMVFARRAAAPFGLPASTGVTHPDIALLWLADGAPDETAAAALLPEVGWLVPLRPAAMKDINLDETRRRYLGQFANALDKPLLGLGVEDIVWAIDGLKADGAKKIVLVCDGPQTSLACLAAGAVPGGPDGIVVRGRVEDYAVTYAFGQPDPTLYFLQPGLGKTAHPDMLLAIAAPRPVAVVGGATPTFAVSVYGAVGAAGALVLEPTDLAAATRAVLTQIP
jgi:dienelactone hydrolase